MRQLGRSYLQHARRHLPQGSDPLDITFPASTPAAKVARVLLDGGTFTAAGSPHTLMIANWFTNATDAFESAGDGISINITASYWGLYVLELDIETDASVTQSVAVQNIGFTYATDVYGDFLSPVAGGPFGRRESTSRFGTSLGATPMAPLQNNLALFIGQDTTISYVQYTIYLLGPVGVLESI